VLAAPYVNVDTSSFKTLPQNTPTPVNLLGTGDATITRTSAVGSPIVVDTWAGTFATSVNGSSNPDWVLGTRTYFDLSVPSPGSVGSTVSYEFLFANGLDTNTQLVFIDFDALERVTIKAYDSFSNLIAFGATSLLLSPGGIQRLGTRTSAGPPAPGRRAYSATYSKIPSRTSSPRSIPASPSIGWFTISTSRRLTAMVGPSVSRSPRLVPLRHPFHRRSPFSRWGCWLPSACGGDLVENNHVNPPRHEWGLGRAALAQVIHREH